MHSEPCVFCKRRSVKKGVVSLCEIHSLQSVGYDDWLSQEEWQAIKRFSLTKTKDFMKKIVSGEIK